MGFRARTSAGWLHLRGALRCAALRCAALRCVVVARDAMRGPLRAGCICAVRAGCSCKLDTR